MENLFYNLTEEDSSKSRKILLWAFSGLFFIGGLYILILSLVFGKTSVTPVLSIAPFGISLIVALIASFETIKRKDLFFSIDENKIEYRYGLIRPRRFKFMWVDIQEITMPSKKKKAILLLKDGSSHVINLNWLERRKSSIIRKHIFYAAKARNLNINRAINLTKK